MIRAQIVLPLCLLITNVLMLGPFAIGNGDPHRVAETFLILWVVALVASIITSVRQAGLKDLPDAMHAVSVGVVILSACGALLNAWAWVVILMSA